MRLLLFLFIVFTSASSWAQPEMQRSLDRQGPSFEADLAQFAIPGNLDLTRLVIYVDVMNDQIQFIKVGDGYEASYEVAAVIFDDDDEQIDGKIWKESLFTSNYDDTNKRSIFSSSSRSFELSPGKHKIVLSVNDLETDLTTSAKVNTTVRSFAKNNLSVSDIVYTIPVATDSAFPSGYRPVVTTINKGLIGPVFAEFDVYQPTQGSEANIEYRIVGEQNKKVFERSFTQPITDFTTPIRVQIPTDSLKHDFYHIDITVQSGGKKINASKPFYIRWAELPRHARDLESAIKQLRYLASAEEWRRLNKAKPDKRLQEFVKFWQRRDPTPGTEQNESQDAYYNRIEFANQNFSVMQREGWQTDMGMLYIMLGSPDDIYREAYPRDSKPYQIWTYYRINREFIFYDDTGFGDYRLYAPISIYEIQRYMKFN